MPLTLSPDYLNFFQLGFVAGEFDAGVETLKQSYGVPEFLTARGAKISSPLGEVAVDGALAFIGQVLIELLVPIGGPDAVYRDFVPPNRGGVRLHHCGHLISDRSRWDRMLDAVAASGLATPLHGVYGDAVRYLYVDTRADFGHYTEFIYIEDPAHNIFAAAPRYSSGDLQDGFSTG